MNVSRLSSVARTTASLAVHPRRWPDARKHIGRAWRGPSGSGSAGAPLVVTDGPVRRSVRAVVLLDTALVDAFAVEWQQTSWQPETDLTGFDVAVVQWPAAPGTSPEDLAAAALAADVPLVVWDVDAPGRPTHSLAGASVVVRSAGRAADYPGAEVAGGYFQPRAKNPVRAKGRAARSVTLDVTPDSTTPGALPRTVQRRADTVVLTGPEDRFLPAAAAAAATGAIVLAPGARTDLPADLVVVDEDEHLPDALARHTELRRRYAHKCLRAALRDHSTVVAAHRLLDAANVPDPYADGSVSAIVPTMRPAQIGHVVDFLARQSHPSVQLVLVAHGFEATETTQRLAAERGLENTVVIEADASLSLGALMNLGVDAADGRYVAKMDDDNFYGRDYLADLVRTFDFSGAQVTGKWAHFTYLEGSGATFLRFPASENKFVKLVQGGTLLMPRDVAAEVRFEDLPRRVDTTFLQKIEAADGRVYSADRYNFVSVRASSTDGHTWKISDSELLAKPSEQLFFGEPWAHVEL
ncbi:glycosyltransferase family 2 protein [Oerskovia flava]|uniref:glycosyltransferase family 2 protein n=1 Tax=Oerskovia flava TaxID=2986422 RepID=UPI00223F2216|nr:glycosyltransferase [Oerskovia sp. JB1-3-2]